MTVWIIAEDEHDYIVIKKLIEKHLYEEGRTVSIQKIKLGGNAGGIGRMAQQLDKLIKTKIGDKDWDKDKDCIVVLHDADKGEPRDDSPYRKVAEVCKYHGVKEIIAHDELESWMLADSGLCEWLGEKTKSKMRLKSWDNEPSPKERLIEYLQKFGFDYPGRRFDQIVEQLVGDGHERSRSMQTAFEMLKLLNCFNP